MRRSPLTRRGRASGSSALSVRLAVAAATLIATACTPAAADRRLESCFATLTGNRVLTASEMSSFDLSTRFGVELPADVDGAGDRGVFVVVFNGPAVIPIHHGDTVINRMHYNAICVWYGEGNVQVYEHVVNDEGVPNDR